MRIPKTVKKTAISALVMLVIFLIAGVVYVFVTGRQANPPAPQKAAAAQDSIPAVFKPAKPAANAPVGVAEESFTTPVKAGDTASIEIRSLPGATCTIKVDYKTHLSKDPGLAAQTANEYGFADWSWTVEPSVTPGTYPVTVSCANSRDSGVYIGNLQVTAG